MAQPAVTDNRSKILIPAGQWAGPQGAAAGQPPRNQKQIRVLLVDDHPVVRRGLASCLTVHQHVVIAGEAADGREALAKAKQLLPDIVLMDIDMPQINGLSATEMLRRENPNLKVLILSMHHHPEYVLRILQSGARGYVLKNAMDLELSSAIRRMVKGETVLDGQLSKQQALKGERNAGLTPREVEILQFICDGKSNKEIANQLELSANTVAVHRANIMDALGIHKTAELVVYAIRNGLVNVP